VTLHLTHEVLTLALRDPFKIARTDHHTGAGVTTVIVELRDERYPGLVGVGEGYPDRFYGETPASMAAVTPFLLEAIGEPELTGAGLAAAAETMAQAIRWNGAAKCAIDIALHDLAGQVQGVPVHRLLDLPADLPPTDFTIGIDEPGIVAERAARASAFPALKIKLGGPQDLATLRAVREVFAGPIRVDANTGWTRDDAQRLLPEVVDLGVELIEQPFPARAYGDLAWLQERSPIPIVADESAVTIEDLEALVGVVGGVNVKLAKCGGIAPAKAMLTAARSLGFRTFLGCMEETQVGSPARRPWRPLPTGSISTAVCSSPMTRSRALSWTPSTAGSCPTDPVWAYPGRLPDRSKRRSERVFAERPFVWITWWMNSWTSPLPASEARGLRCPATAAETSGREGRDSGNHPSGGRLASPIPSDRASCCLRRRRFAPAAKASEGGNAVDGRAHRQPRSRRSGCGGVRALLLPPTTSGLAGALRRDVRGGRPRPLPGDGA
jgi:L-alanine-DL-glutamate epimerase-like enolase superfamily enzyme